jgi:putative ABC transport system permease protein
MWPSQQRRSLMLVARTRDGNSAVNEIRETIAAVNPALTLAATYAAEQYSTLGLLPQRIGATVTAALGAIGVLLAAVGVFGVTAHAVIRRAREIGIRIALGAAPRSVARLILNEGMSLVVLGSLLGVGTGVGAATLVAGYLAGLPPLDPVAFGGAPHPVRRNRRRRLCHSDKPRTADRANRGVAAQLRFGSSPFDCGSGVPEQM